MFKNSGDQFRLLFLMFIMALFMASCSTSSHSRTGKYSSSNKRQARTYQTKSRAENPSTRTTANNTNYKSANSSDVRHNIVEYALKFRGTKYRYGGKSPDTGFDCSGFTGFVFTQNGISVSGPSHHLAQLGKPKSMQQLSPGDLVFFGDKTKISHVAIVSERTKDAIQIVHATTSQGVKVDEILNSEYWVSRFLYGRDLISQ